MFHLGYIFKLIIYCFYNRSLSYNLIITVVNIEVGQTTSYATYTGISNTIRFNTNNEIDIGSLG